MQMILPATPFFRWITGYRPHPKQIPGCQREELPRRKILTERFASGGRVHCLTGSLWITRDGFPDDIVLGAGCDFIGEAGSRLVMEALEDTVVEIVRGA
ncbi:MAG: DUF2917 domain-containing protein [Verrucomicrobiota bacterium]